MALLANAQEDAASSGLGLLPVAERILDSAEDNAWEFITPESIAQVIGAVAAALALVSSLSHICRHLALNDTPLRACTVRLLCVVPIFAVDCWACLMVENATYPWVQLLTAVREVYEAVALLCFLELVLTILGGPEALAVEEAERCVKHLWPLSVILKPYGPRKPFIFYTVRGIFQYVLVALLFFIVCVAIWCFEVFGVFDNFCKWLHIIALQAKSISCAWALYCLALFAHEVQDQFPNMGLVLKFMSIKGIVFFTFWQGKAILVLDHLGVWRSFEAYVSDESAHDWKINAQWWNQGKVNSGLNDLLLCIEVLIFSVLHWFAYPAREARSLPPERLKKLTTARSLWRYIRHSDFLYSRTVLEQTLRVPMMTCNDLDFRQK